jgi:hypothetical protein
MFPYGSSSSPFAASASRRLRNVRRTWVAASMVFAGKPSASPVAQGLWRAEAAA